MDPPNRIWSIHTRPELIQRYAILERVGAGAYSDVYKGRRLSDGLTVALKEIHDYQSAFREIEALQVLQSSPNVVVLHEYFWIEDADAVLVLELLRSDLASLIRDAKKSWEGGISVGEITRWMVQILLAVDACHRNSIVHRDLKPSNLLISETGVLKLADFGQARILIEPEFDANENNPHPDEPHDPYQVITIQHAEVIPETDNSRREGSSKQQKGTMSMEEYAGNSEDLKANSCVDGIDKGTNFLDGNASCLATCTTSDVEEDDPFQGSYSYEAGEGGDDAYGNLTSCVGTRWFKAPELLYGCTYYGQEIDLWSLGCIFAELLSLEPLFPGTSDIDQLSRIFNVLGNLSEENSPGCSKYPDYGIISFNKVENPVGLEACLSNRSPDEILLVKKLLCFDPASRAAAMELLHDKYLNEEPLPVPVSELRVPSTHHVQDEGSVGQWCDYEDMDSDTEFEDFSTFNVTTTNAGFSIQFPLVQR